MPEQHVIFVVGNSRSGTTMTGRMFDRHSEVHCFQELHFFEQMVETGSIRDPGDWSEDRLLAMLERLLTSERDVLFAPVVPGRYGADARAILDRSQARDPVSVYGAFLQAEAERAGAIRPCEQTPRYLFQAEEILDAFPEARMLCLLRDPRSVLLSQKNKWRRRKLGASNMPAFWAFRAWVNYHPYTMSRMWVSASRRARRLQSHPRFLAIRFEDLAQSPETTVRKICDHAGLAYEPTMLEIGQIGSSTGKDRPDERGIDPGRIDAWQSGGLSGSEIALCEKVARADMAEWNYATSGRRLSPLVQAGQMTIFVFKSFAALLLNLRRSKNLIGTIRSRFFS
ncbi:sulfotransferase [Tropicimonas sp. TH_r6]|uniref:sulfotransferase family protein n=1 Tax=Tropicimonas sp. TH_r6 TaxID=3082085 RepID=UPI002953EA28|nr:sulfotransferase [Tropicimonas sp. TH_r6]MDV7142071.1 sulfotransferase [Tropicimonas sp. TH_r6]